MLRAELMSTRAGDCCFVSLLACLLIPSPLQAHVYSRVLSCFLVHSTGCILHYSLTRHAVWVYGKGEGKKEEGPGSERPTPVDETEHKYDVPIVELNRICVVSMVVKHKHLQQTTKISKTYHVIRQTCSFSAHEAT